MASGGFEKYAIKATAFFDKKIGIKAEHK